MKIRGFMAMLLLSTVIVFFIYTMKTNETAQIEQSIGAFDRAKHRLTETNMMSLQKAAELYTATKGRVPSDLKEVFGRAPLTRGSKTVGDGISNTRSSTISVSASLLQERMEPSVQKMIS